MGLLGEAHPCARPHDFMGMLSSACSFDNHYLIAFGEGFLRPFDSRHDVHPDGYGNAVWRQTELRNEIGDGRALQSRLFFVYDDIHIAVDLI